MKRALDYLALPRTGRLNIRVPDEWKTDLEREWKRAQKEPGGERYRTFTDFVMIRLTPEPR